MLHASMLSMQMGIPDTFYEKILAQNTSAIFILIQCTQVTLWYNFSIIQGIYNISWCKINCKISSIRFFKVRIIIRKMHYKDVTMGMMASQIPSLTIVYSTIYSGPDQRKHQSSTSLAFVRGIHWSPVNSPHKGPVTWKMYPFEDVIMGSDSHYALHDVVNPVGITNKCHIGTSSQAPSVLNTLRPRQDGCHFRQDGRHFPDNIFKCIFLNENLSIFIKISLKFVPNGPINNIPALVQIMAWHRSGDKPLSEPMMVSLLTYICLTRPHWVKHVGLVTETDVIQPWFN